MNKFLKNNKIITCILCFVLINSPASASRATSGPSDTSSEGPRPPSSSRSHLLSGISSVQQYRNQLLGIMNAQDLIAPQAHQGLSMHVKETGVYVFPGDEYFIQNTWITGPYIGCRHKYVQTLNQRLGLQFLSLEIKNQVMKSAPPWLVTIYYQNLPRWTLKRCADVKQAQPPSVGAPPPPAKPANPDGEGNHEAFNDPDTPDTAPAAFSSFEQDETDGEILFSWISQEHEDFMRSHGYWK
ncbi:MAG: hypothetical protein NkDv07_0759 [Candidatus Improbicoccus devescovinae]|nr:MAG: hypothetical protein NkDv07_0759 [Candidatus Improbicoccus devescovinae]